MNMMQMVAIMVICYFITLTMLAFNRHLINVKVGNAVFIIVDVIFFFCWNLAEYQRGSLEGGFMTFENISPFIMTLIPLTVFMSERVRAYCNSAIAFLWMGMFLALMISPQHAYIFSYRIEASPLYCSEAACHLIASLYGAYLIITKQVKCDFKSWRRSVVCMFSVIGFGLFLNYVFHLGNFGMNPYGNYSIYMLDIFGSFEATLFAYLCGVLIVLTIGMQSGYGFFKLVESAHGEHIAAMPDVWRKRSAEKSKDDEKTSEVTSEEAKQENEKTSYEEETV